MKQRRRGFALVLAVGVIGTATALLTLTLVSASSHRRRAIAARYRMEARCSALLGLEEAIANLQLYAGPDQRVTASDSSGKTGVWDSQSTGITPLEWLMKDEPRYSWSVADDASRAAASVASMPLPDLSPYDSAELRSRIRQQVALKPVNSVSGLLADSRAGGLRRNLSLEPNLLGASYAAWANYAGYMENPAAPGAPLPSPPYGSDPVRRRYRLAPLSPVLTYFLLTFNIRTQAGSSAVKPIEARVRWMMTLWNPYTAAFVPENLRLEVSGLPASLQLVDESAGGAVTTLSLGGTYEDPLRIAIPWDSSIPDPERQSWLPGRVYTWTALENLSGTQPSAGFASRFNSRNLSADAGQGIQKLASNITIDGDDICHLTVNQPQALTARLYVARSSGDGLLATFHSPEFAAFTTTPRKLSAGTYQFSYLFRLAESFDTPATPGVWLTTPGRDVRAADLASAAFVPGANGNRPELYENFVTISAPDRFLDRAGNAMSYNEDVPVFELPRTPILSLGTLQHLPIAQTRPFAIGNPWGVTATINGIPANSVFDRFYFSPIAPSPMPDAVIGAFNVNSLDTAAWAAVLRTSEFDPSSPVTYLDASAVTGTAADTSIGAVATAGATYFRFAQSAQETAKADTLLFRRGWRELTDTQTTALAEAVVQINSSRRALSGPWRSMEEFINAGVFTDAIAAAALNAGVTEFSTQWLTQADVLTPLAPILFARSDTFTIRAEGRSITQLTGQVRERTFLEAKVVRTADYIDPSDPPERLPAALNPLNTQLGRRFRILSFRWLNESGN